MEEEIKSEPTGAAETDPEEESLIDQTEAPTRRGWREIFRQAVDKARREQLVTKRRDLARDRSRSLFVLAGAAIALLLVLLGVFSSSNTARKTADERLPGTPNLGHRRTPGHQAAGQAGSVTPLLKAQTGQQELQGSQGVTPEDVDRTARPVQSTGVPPTTSVGSHAGPYALGKVDFSDPTTRQQGPAASTPLANTAADDLRKPSLVFVRGVQSNPTSGSVRMTAMASKEDPAMLELPAGTKLVARLQSVVNSTVKAPVVAAIEYNYERDGHIVVPAGAKALGSLQQTDRSGSVYIRFDTLQMPDGATRGMEATAMSLAYGPLKGNVHGKKTGARFLVRTFTGLGTVATYLVGAGGTNGFNRPLSESALLRERLATNIGIAGDQELNSLAFNQNIVVTVPGNTRFYIVVGKGGAAHGGEARLTATEQVNNRQLPTMQELRELMQLRRELAEMYQQSNVQTRPQPLPQQ